MRGAQALVVATMLSITASSSAAAFATVPHSPAPIPVAWRVTGARAFNEPALLPNGVVTTAGNTATARGLAHGVVLWRQSIPDQFGYAVALLAPTVYNGAVDSVMSTGFAAGVADFALADGTPTLHGPTIHNIVGQLVVDSVTSTRLQGSYGTNFGPLLTLPLAGQQWFVVFGPNNVIGQPALVGTRAFVPIDTNLVGYDPAQGCKPLPVPNPPNMCAPTWEKFLPGTPHPPVGAGSGRIVTTDATGVVTALDPATGKVLWSTPSYGTAFGAPAYSNGIVYAGGADGALRAFNATTGKLIWKASAGAPITTAPTISGGRAFVATDNGRLLTFDAAGCGTATCAPAAVGNAAFAGTHAAGAPLVRQGIAVVAYGTHLVAFTV